MTATTAQLVAEHHLPHVLLGEVSILVYQDSGKVAVVLRYGNTAEEPVPVRIQSACLYGEVLGAVDCDCRAQLAESFQVFQREKRGLLIYLEQEGRGAGLAVKARAYALQENANLDTVQAYEQLGVEVDQRDYGLAAHVLHLLGIKRVDLLTNNWRKEQQLRAQDVKVERSNLRTPVTVHNSAYLHIKQEKLGHSLGL